MSGEFVAHEALRQRWGGSYLVVGPQTKLRTKIIRSLLLTCNENDQQTFDAGIILRSEITPNRLAAYCDIVPTSFIVPVVDEECDETLAVDNDHREITADGEIVSVANNPRVTVTTELTKIHRYAQQHPQQRLFVVLEDCGLHPNHIVGTKLMRGLKNVTLVLVTSAMDLLQHRHAFDYIFVSQGADTPPVYNLFLSDEDTNIEEHEFADLCETVERHGVCVVITVGKLAESEKQTKPRKYLLTWRVAQLQFLYTPMLGCEAFRSCTDSNSYFSPVTQ